MSSATCVRCSAPVPPDARFCPACGERSSPSISGSQTPTMFSSGAPPGASAPGRRPRFVAGEIVADRYRIEGLLGRGGMGEVYRAEDLKIDSTVALKFLPSSLQQNATMLARFHNEVRLARQVSHPNVCRVHDIGEVDHQHFLTMEFVGGENLASLLRRIGRLPGDKAVEIARQICAGLAAAHDRGVLHRDLKPENVMLDGEGRVRLMDFGLAAMHENVSVDDLRSGTPAYMAPEQLDGREITVRSDIYALGLILHEMFTGRAIFDAATFADLHRQRQTFTPERASLTSADADPAVERVIRRCLEGDPEKRPASALAVAMALSGGDPLHAALAAGETPSPEMVAAAGAELRVSRSRAWLAVGLFVAGLIAAVASSSERTVVGHAAVALPPDALAERARDALRGAGFDEPAADRAYGFRPDREALAWLRSKKTGRSALETLRIGATTFWYRQAPRALEPENIAGVVTPGDPYPASVSGSAVVLLDEAGRLLSLLGVPPQVPGAENDAGAAADWRPLFKAAGLDVASFVAGPSEWLPSVFADTRLAWKGSWPETPDIPLRIEAASYRGKPVWFEVVRPWSRPARVQVFEASRSERLVTNLNIALVAAALGGALFVARRSFRAGRADTRGALRVSAAAFLLTLANWACRAHHRASAQGEWGMFLEGTALALLISGIICVLYLGLEPVVRKRLPHALIGWSRLISGWFRDPRVARDVLYGLGAAGIAGLVLAAVNAGAAVLGTTSSLPALSNFDAALGFFSFVGQLASSSVAVLITPMLILLLVAVLTSLLRSGTAALVVTLLLIGALAAGQATTATGSPILGIVAGFFTVGAMLFVLKRVGLLALMAFLLPNVVVNSVPATLDPAHWFFGYTAAVLAILVAFALGAVRFASSAAVPAE